MKTCSKCKVPKPLSEFTKRKSSKDGYYCYCKACCKKAYQEVHLKKLYGSDIEDSWVDSLILDWDRLKIRTAEDIHLMKLRMANARASRSLVSKKGE